MNVQQKILFDLGQILATPGALDALTKNNTTGLDLLRKHVSGDWGILTDDDRQANQDALESGDRILSSYMLSDETKLWVITEATDDSGKRMATTILLPDEY
jgi:exonuclease V gamma subunit